MTKERTRTESPRGRGSRQCAGRRKKAKVSVQRLITSELQAEGWALPRWAESAGWEEKADLQPPLPRRGCLLVRDHGDWEWRRGEKAERAKRRQAVAEKRERREEEKRHEVERRRKAALEYQEALELAEPGVAIRGQYLPLWLATESELDLSGSSGGEWADARL